MQRVSGCRAPVLRARGYIVNAFTSATRHSSRRESAMRFTLLTTLVAFAIVACGGDKKPVASQAEAATPTPAGASANAAAPEPLCLVVEVKTTGNGTSVEAIAHVQVTVTSRTT